MILYNSYSLYRLMYSIEMIEVINLIIIIKNIILIIRRVFETQSPRKEKK